jgi:hypothetical protein
MSLLHVTARAHPRIPLWMLDDAAELKLLAQFPSLAFIAVSVGNDDGTPRTGLEAGAFSLLLLATPEPVSSQGAKIAVVREESLAGFYGLVVAPKSKTKWPLGELVVGLQVKASKVVGSRTVTSQGRTVVRVFRN